MKSLQARARRKIEVSIFKLSRLWRQPAARKAKSLERERAEHRGRPERDAEVGHAGGGSRSGAMSVPKSSLPVPRSLPRSLRGRAVPK